MRGLAVLLALAGVSSAWLAGPALAVQLPDLTVLTLQAPSAFTDGPNPVIPVQWAVTNLGGAVSPGSSWLDTLYFSTNSQLDGTATVLRSQNLSSDWLLTGSYEWTQWFDLPITNSGTWYLHFKTDDTDLLEESDEANNVATVRLSATILPPDLKPLALVCPETFSGPPSPYVPLAWGVTNQGPGPADGFPHPWVDVLWLSTNAYLDGTERQVVYDYSVFTNKLDAGGCYWVTNRVRLPATQSGRYYLILQVAPNNHLLESDPNNNTISVPLDFQATPPDLAPIRFEALADFTGSPNPSLTFAWGVTNQGAGPAIGQVFTIDDSFDGWLDGFYISTNSVLDATARGIGSWVETNRLDAGASYYRTNTFTLPVVASGTYYLFLVTDDFNELEESTFGNNTLGRPITLTLLPPDLAPLPLEMPTVITGAPGALVPIILAVTNQGVGSAIAPLGGWYDRLELWTGPDYPGMSWSRLVGQWAWTNPVPAGSCYRVTNTLSIPPGGGQFSLRFHTDAWESLFESNETNNIVSSPLTIMIPPALESPVLGYDGSFCANALGTLGFDYTLQASSNLVNWVDVSTYKYTFWPTLVSDPAGSGQPQRFYRVVPAPTSP